MDYKDKYIFYPVHVKRHTDGGDKMILEDFCTFLDREDTFLFGKDETNISLYNRMDIPAKEQVFLDKGQNDYKLNVLCKEYFKEIKEKYPICDFIAICKVKMYDLSNEKFMYDLKPLMFQNKYGVLLRPNTLYGMWSPMTYGMVKNPKFKIDSVASVAMLSDDQKKLLKYKLIDSKTTEKDKERIKDMLSYNASQEKLHDLMAMFSNKDMLDKYIDLYNPSERVHDHYTMDQLKNAISDNKHKYETELFKE